MVCVICQESVAKAATAPSPAVSALGCGHTFHGKCIEEWFRSSERCECPMCHRVHYGKPIALFIELDDGSAAKPKRRRRRRGKNKTSTSQAESAGDQSPLCVGDNPNYAELLIDSFGGLLVSENSYDQWRIRELEEDVEDLKLQKEWLIASQEKELKAQQEKMQSEKDTLQREINRLNRLSTAHTTHIASLQKALEREKSYNQPRTAYIGAFGVY
ncbi:hypothetical protein H4R19_004453 [Coemansia spiralis]|nr:hypothetical protein H4R19_004453 [Coemansia spiralis]